MTSSSNDPCLTLHVYRFVGKVVYIGDIEESVVAADKLAARAVLTSRLEREARGRMPGNVTTEIWIDKITEES